MSITIQKYGGTSMSCMNNVAEIIAKEPDEKKVVIVSALSGVTNTLIDLIKVADNKKAWQTQMSKIKNRHYLLMDQLGVNKETIQFLLQSLERTHRVAKTPWGKALIPSFGERLSSTILSAHLNNQGYNSQSIAATNLISTNNNYNEGEVDFAATSYRTNQIIPNLLEEGITPIITGFIGLNPAEKRTTLLGRGGSDYSATIIANALSTGGQQVDEVQIWTDVSGVYSANPKQIPEAQPINQLTYNQARLLAENGAKVLHPRTMAPVSDLGIPVRVVNTSKPQDPGTIITNNKPNNIHPLSITTRRINGNGRTDICLVGGVGGIHKRVLELIHSLDPTVEAQGRSEDHIKFNISTEIAQQALRVTYDNFIK